MARSVAEFETDPETTEAERALIAACRVGKPCKLNGGKLPAEGAEEPKVRAALIRLLAVEATSLHEKGVWLEGAVITGELDLSFDKCRGGLLLAACRFDHSINMLQTELTALALNLSHFPSLCAQGCNVARSALLRGVKSAGTVTFDGARVYGDLAFKHAELNSRDKGKNFDDTDSYDKHLLALTAQGANIAGSVYLDCVSTTGTVNLAGAQIGGQLSCELAEFNGKTRDSLIAQSLNVAGAIVFRSVNAVTGCVDLSSAHAGDLLDDAESWSKCSELFLDGFTYDRISGVESPKTFTARKEWLEKGSRVKTGEDSHTAYQFFPQPYTQFAAVMRAAGHIAEARAALVEQDRILFAEAERADRAALRQASHGDQSARADCGKIWLRLHGRRWWAGLTHWVVGYGHKPERALFCALGFWLLGTVIYFVGWRAGLMVPNAETGLPPTAFVSAIYALDLFMPVMDFGQERAWEASGQGFWGAVLQLASFGYQIAGWVVVSLGLAAVTGFVQRNGPE